MAHVKATAQASSESRGRSNDSSSARHHGAASGTAASGAPGKPARWAAGDKVGVGTANSTMSSVWFTLRHGILTEVYYPSVDTAATRDLKMLVAADAWHNPQRIRTRDTGLGIHLADLPTEDLAAGATVVFRFDIADGRPEERQEEFRVIVADENPTATPAQPGSNDRAAPKAGFAGSKLTSPP